MLLDKPGLDPLPGSELCAVANGDHLVLAQSGKDFDFVRCFQAQANFALLNLVFTIQNKHRAGISARNRLGRHGQRLFPVLQPKQ